MPARQPVLQVDGVSKKYCRNLKRSLWYGVRDLATVFSGADANDRSTLRPGEFLAIEKVTFDVLPGECLALLGPNGAGKSTLLKMINGLLRPDTGAIRIRGQVGALIELNSGSSPILSGRENVFINGAVLGLSTAEVEERFDEIVDFAGLQEVIDDPVQTYSSGMKVRLGFSIAAHLRPRLLLLDEVLAVGDIGFRLKCFDHLRQLKQKGVAIIVVTHAVGMLPRIADRAIVLNDGGLQFDGDLQRGICAYEEQTTVDSLSAARDEDARSRSASIQSCVLRNERGERIDEIRTADSLIVEITIQADVAISRVRVIVALASPVYGVVASMVSDRDLELNLRPPVTVVTLKLPCVPLLLGAYYVNARLIGRNGTEVYDERNGVSTLRVIRPAEDTSRAGGNGIVRLDHQWHNGPYSEWT